MLAPVAFLLTILVLATGVAVAGIGAAARASLHAAAHAAVAPAFHHAVDGYQAQIAALIAAQLAAAPPRDAANSVAAVAVPPALADPATVGAPARITESIPPFVVTEDIANTTLAAPSCMDSADAPHSGVDAPDTVIAAQCSPWVAESRLSASITVDVWGSDPAADPAAPLLAQETETVAFRLVADAPYAMLAGIKTGDARDPTDDSVADASPHEGDADGYSTAVAPLATPPGDTTIHLTYQCQPSAANQPCPYVPLANSPGDDPTSLPWMSGNAEPAPGAP